MNTDSRSPIAERRSSFLIPHSSFLVLLLALLAPARGDERPPNIVFILADDVGIEALRCYGGESYETPRLDRLAAEGTRFTHGFAMAVCHPTRVCLLTGRYPFRLGNPRWGAFPKAAEKQTVANVLKRAGYRTAVAGKWQLTLLKKDLEHPHRLGFDEYSLFGWHEGPRYHDPLIWQNGERRGDVKERYGPAVYVDFLLDFAKRHRDDPLFLWYSMALCHDVTDDLKQPVPYGPHGRYETFGEMVEAMDEQVGRLVDGLDALGLRENTLIVFTGDNGTPTRSIIRADENGKMVREPVTSRFKGREIPGGKGSLDDGGTLVPLIARWPGTVAKGAVVDDLVDMSDYHATFADLAGAKTGDVDGRSFASRLLRNEPGPRTWAFAEHRGRSWVRDRRYRLYDDGRLFEVRGRGTKDRGPIDPAEQTADENRTRARLTEVQRSLLGKR